MSGLLIVFQHPFDDLDQSFVGGFFQTVSLWIIWGGVNQFDAELFTELG
jgi:hypothetical protein